MIKGWLEGIIPECLLEGLEDGIGWRILSKYGREVEWDIIEERRAEDGWRLLFKGREEYADLEGRLDIKFVAEQRAVIFSLSLKNRGNLPSPPINGIHPLSFFWSQPRKPIRLRYLSGGLTYGFYPSFAYQEFTTELLSYASEPLTIECGPDGRSSNKYLPMMEITLGEAGLVFGMEWSGLWFISLHHPFLSLTAGIPVSQLVIEPGETLSLPPVHIVFFEGDLDEGGNAFRRYLYKCHCPKLDGELPLPPVSYDHWFHIACDFNEEFLRRQVDCCAELGVEYFVLDAGWYAGCGEGGDFSRGVGNWKRIDVKKFPDSIESLAEYVHSKGMKFGMWFEVERAHRESDIVKEHPDWFFDIGEEFLHLDLSKREAQDGIVEIISGWVERLNLRWIRYDYNIGPKPFWESADRTGKVQFKYVEGLYRVLDELMLRHPNLLIECCASGGRRIDLGTLKRAHTIWFSDHTDDPHICRFMQSGANRFLPGHLLNSAVPTPIGGGDMGRTAFDFLSRMVGAFSLDGDIASWSPELRKMVSSLIRIYKEIRYLLVQDFYPLTPHPKAPGEGEVVLFLSHHKDEAVLLGFGMNGEGKELIVKLRALLPEAMYEIENMLNVGRRGKSFISLGEKLLTKGIRLDLSEGACVYRLRRLKI